VDSPSITSAPVANQRSGTISNSCRLVFVARLRGNKPSTRRILMPQIQSDEEIAFGRFADLHRIYSIPRSTAYLLISARTDKVEVRAPEGF
jgi:hypothetical protein